MSVTIDKNNTISLNRGDTFQVPLFINAGTAMAPIRYVLQEEDEVYLGIMEPNQYFEEALVKKKFTKLNLNTKGDVVIRIEHDDTKCLLPGKYYYQVKSKLKVNTKTFYQDINIVSISNLKVGSLLTKGCVINGIDISDKINELGYYTLEEDINLDINDEIKAGSKIMSGSVINNETIDSVFEVNTVIPKTEIFIME